MKNNSILESLKKIYTKMTGKKVVKRKTETDVLSDIAEEYNPNQGGGGTSVSGTDDGTNWTSLTIGDKTRAIPQGGSGGEGNPYLFSYAELANYIIGKHLSVDALVDLFEEKGIDDTLINTCKNVMLTTGRSIISISIDCDASLILFNLSAIPLTVSGSTGYIDAIIAAKSDIESITFSLDNITQWYAPEETPHGSPIISGYRAQVEPNDAGTIVTTFGKFTAITFDEIKALFVETV